MKEDREMQIIMNDEDIMDSKIQLFHFEEINSTNTYAKDFIKTSENNLLIVADRQSKGKGRKEGRVFYSPKGIYATLALKDLKVQSRDILKITLLSAIAISEVLDSYYEIKTKVKWVNDIYFNKKKIVGILCESNFIGSELNYAIIGFGINVDDIKIPSELEDKMTTLEKETGKKVSKEKMLLDIVKRILAYLKELEEGKFLLVEKFNQRNYLIDKKVCIQEEDNVYEVVGISKEGYLIVRNDVEERVLNAEEISVYEEKGCE